MTKLNGGYLTLKTDAVKATEYSNAHTAALDRPMTGAHLEALNWIQKTRWRVNRNVLAVALGLKERGWAVEGWPSAEEIPAPVWQGPGEMDRTTEAGKAFLREREEVHYQNARNAGMRKKLWDMLGMAQELATFPAIWFPHYADFRGRFYPRPQDLHTQGDSLVKGLLEFSESQALGANGQYWVYVNTANYYGEDKLPLDDRAKWTADHMMGILAVAEDPFGTGFDFWSKADSPWEFLAACYELKRLRDWLIVGNPAETFPSTLVCRYDATCSGIQHLAALMKDDVSALQVNVVSQGPGIRADIYTKVKDAVVALVNLDRVDSRFREAAELWVDRVVRGTVKRAVMTTPYGVSERGILNQIINDGFADHVEKGKPRYAAAEYLTQKIVSALDESIDAPRRAMAYFREVAKFLDKKDLPLAWDTPSGFTAKQAYYKTNQKQVRTLHGDVLMRFEMPEAGFAPGKQVLGAAPNVVHSFDAAHLALVAVAMKHEGVRDLAFVHDSFGCHAGNSDLLLKVTKEQFVAIYNRDTLEEWRQSVIKHSGCPDIPEVPPLGSLDVTKVLESEFFFS